MWFRSSEQEFRASYENALIVISDIYGKGSDKYAKVRERLEKCKTVADVDNALAWARVNLL